MSFASNQLGSRPAIAPAPLADPRAHHARDPALCDNLPVWCFQGLRDDVVPPHETREIVRWLRELKASGGLDTTNVRATFYPDANHNSWDAAFAEAELPGWIAGWLGAK